MKGLLRNNFYSMGGNLQLAFGLSFLLIFVPLLLGEKDMLPTVLAMQTFMFVANIGTSLHTDVASKWNSFEVTLPVTRSDVINARYLSFLFLILCGVIMSAITSLLAISNFEALRADAVIFGFSFGISLSLITAAFMYPIMLKVGTEKNELIIVICGATAVALFLIVLKIAAPLVSDSAVLSASSLIGIIFTLVSLGLFVLSYFVSRAIYQKKEL